jgi:hypothetical protein
MAGTGSGIGWGIRVVDQEVQALLRKYQGPDLARRVEAANLECATQVESRAMRHVHVLTGALEGSIDADLGVPGGSGIRFAWVGASTLYAAIEELRGLSAAWGDITLEQAAAGDHSYLAKAYVDSVDTFAEIYLHHLNPDR